ncbi:MAG TPA: hypothetical protein VF570_20550 [Pyrinomonadaceae bacterium]
MVITALLIFFWAVVPGLITGWMLRERGRSFLPGLLLGVVCGPLGILAALAFIYVSDRRRARGHGHMRAVRVFYEIPLVGRLHVSTVWALAGLATFLCLWMVGGITYEVYRAGLSTPPTPEQARQTAADSARPNSLLPSNAPPEKQAPETTPAGQTPSNTAAQARSALLGNFSGQPAQPAAGVASPGNSSMGLQPAPPTANPVEQPAPGVAAAVVTPQPNAPPTPQPPKATAPARADAVAEVTRDLASRGHRVHAAVSGDPQSATLSLTGATLTREAGNQLLGNGRLRGALKAVGVRVVVVLNGGQSWTYML